MSGSTGSLLQAWARRGITQPVDAPVPADDAQFLARKGTVKVAFRVAKRRVEVGLSGQGALLVDRIDPRWTRAVWFHHEAPQIGDALMDLAPRSLLAERGITVDLVAPMPVASLFRGDRWFGRVGADAGEIQPGDYDFAIVDASSRRALAAKRGVAPGLPWVSMLGDYIAYDFQRGLLATRRLAALLDTTLAPPAEQWHARQKLQRRGETAPPHDEPPRIAIALGGVRAERTYGHWPEVARRLFAAGVDRFALIGSGNGRDAAAAVTAAIPGANVLDLVAATDLYGTQLAMGRASLVLCADGGLLHLACTTTTPLVALFDASIDPAWRLPLGGDATALRADGRDVGGIAPAAVVAAALDALAPGPFNRQPPQASPC